MKKYLLYLLLISSGIFLFSFTNYYKTTSDQIAYTESSSGLQTINLDGGRTEIEIADINLDGHPDFISIGDHGSPYVNTQEHGIMIWYGNGSGANWNLIQNGNFGYGGIAIGDVNNDGLPDVAYGMHHNYSTTDFGDQLIEAALGDGTGMNWTPWDDSLGTRNETYGMFTTDLGDIDNDGLLDIGVVSFGCCNGLRVYKNMGSGIWRGLYTVTSGNTMMDFVFGDINNDGNPDFAVAHNAGTPYFGDGAGNFILRHNNLPAPTNFGFKGVSLGDVNNDGSKDIAFISSGGAVNVWKWNDGSQNWDNLSNGLPVSGNAAATDLSDMNMDGFTDLTVYGAGVITIWAGNGGTTWAQIANFTTHGSSGAYSDFTIGDVDHNGFPDIVIEAYESSRNKIKLFRETTPFTALSVMPKYPKGFERFKNNSVKFIEWLSSAPENQTTKVKLELSISGSSGPWTLIADSIPNNGRYQWRVPAGVNSSNCFIRYSAYIIGGSSASSMNQNPFIIGSLVSVNNNGNELPKEFMLYQNYPNPFNPMTKIRFQTPLTPPEGGKRVITLIIYDVLGKEIASLIPPLWGEQEGFKPGTYEVEWNASNYPSGIYFYSLTAGEFSQTKKALLVK